MDAQGLGEGNLRNSHRETHAVRRKPAPAKLQQRAYALVESCSSDLILRQRLDPEKVEGLFKRAPFFVLESVGRGTPGFLVFLPGQPAVFLQLIRGRPPLASTLRLRVSSSIGDGGGSVLIATLDDVLHTLRLEDVWMWRGAPVIQREPFTARRNYLKEFVEHHWVPDARLLGGIYASVATPLSLEQFAAKKEWSQVASVEFIPEAPGRRRMYFLLEEIARAATGPAAEKKFRDGARGPGLSALQGPRLSVPTSPAPAPVPKPSSAVPAAAVPTDIERKVRAVPVEKMPDIYDLFDDAGFPISRASVQQFALSQTLRGLTGDLWVKARWRKQFGGYEIVAVA